MDYFSAFAISGSGMSVEKLRLDVTALNLANMNSTRAAGGALYQPLSVISNARPGAFAAALAGAANAQLGAQVTEVAASTVVPRLVYEPGHPSADNKGFVAYPGINTVNEMVTLISATRAYEANVAALNAAKVMALKALDIGGGN
jgi:flagellar basal-body rod protein FlgC